MISPTRKDCYEQDANRRARDGRGPSDDPNAAWDDVVNEAYDWTYADDNALTVAYNDLDDAIVSLPGDDTVSEDLQSRQPEITPLAQAYKDTFDGSGCASA